MASIQHRGRYRIGARQAGELLAKLFPATKARRGNGKGDCAPVFFCASSVDANSSSLIRLRKGNKAEVVIIGDVDVCNNIALDHELSENEPKHRNHVPLQRRTTNGEDGLLFVLFPSKSRVDFGS